MDARRTSLTKQPHNSLSPIGTDDAPPACSVGRDLLRQLREARSNDSAFLEAQDFADLSASAFIGIPEWDSFGACKTCGDCLK
jgi:hypothetical protein